MKRAIRFHGTQAVKLVLLMILGVAVGGYIFGHQNFVPPSWFPFVGKEHFYLDARFETANGVAPGQGQAVTISGIRVGDVAGVRLDRGVAVVRLRMGPKHAKIYPDASFLLRPKTGLKDMVVEVDPGTPAAGAPLKDGATVSSALTAPDVNLDEVLASLDSDTRAELANLLSEAGVALGGSGGRALARDLRRFTPLSYHSAEATRLVARRSGQLRRLVHNLGLIADELGNRDQQLARFVRSSADVFRRFANQNRNLGEALDRFPAALRASDEALGKAKRFARTLQTASPRLLPGARALPTAMRDLRPFLRQTTPVLREQLRPFSRTAQPTVRALAPAARDLAAAAPDLDRVLRVFNALTDTLAFDPPGEQKGYLYYLPWANHNTNSALGSQDGVGALRRSMVYLPCGALSLADVVVKNNPTLGTLLRLLTVPTYDQTCRGTPDKDDNKG
ncbi:MlaD family protein [Patulibacter defluvii]|uniref:MlaD family protein n=1 Tax=Patulibacter defluvii TaxID=3095358 RepID=UPI002A74DF2C|nr:MlaD family protein [Patulibacter sp. DM4]